MSKAVKTKMDKLSELIEHYNKQYFVNKKSDVEDAVFDQLVRQLQFLEEKYPQYANSNSPTQKVGETIENNTFESVRHRRRMPSLGKSMSVDELYDFAVKVYKELVRIFVFEPKIDGLALELRYENGVLVQGVTRGDGEVGDDVTATALSIQDVPNVLDEPFTGEIRGEAYMKKSDFLAYNKTRELMGLKTYANTRNLASGILKRKEVTEENTLISFLAYGIVDDDNEFEYYSEGIQKLDQLGFNTSLLIMSKLRPFNAPSFRIDATNSTSYESLQTVLEGLVDEWTEIRPDLDFDIDGLVLKADKISQQEALGETRHSPNWATAFKFPAEEAITTLLDVEWTMGNKGNITPNARIEPVQLLGVTVSNITLHNIEELKRLGIMIGDTIVVSRRGDVIPKVEKVVEELRTGDETPIEIPSQCPADGAPTHIDGPFLRCSHGDECEYMYFAKIQNFVHTMEIDELGPNIIEKMLEAGIVNDLADLYDVKPEQIEVLERMGKRSAQKIVKNIQASRDNDLYRVISGLTIKNVSVSTAEDLADKYQSLEAFVFVTEEELTAISGIGPKTAKYIHDWCTKEKNQELIFKLIDRKVGQYKELVTSSSKLAGKVFATSGKVSTPRKQLEAMIVDNGGEFTSIKKGITHFIAGDGAKQPKIDKATSLGAEVITESDFLDMLK